MKKYIFLIYLTPLAALLAAEITAWLLWPGQPVGAFWSAPWTVMEFASWHIPLYDHVVYRFLTWLGAHHPEWITSETLNQWLQNSADADAWLRVYHGFVYAAIAAGCTWGAGAAFLTWKYASNCVKAGNVRVPPKKENQHFLFAGSTQSGKTSCVLQTLSILRRRGDPVILVDPCGEFAKHFYKEGGRNDRIASPGEERSLKWSPAAELKAGIKPELLAERIVGEGVGDEKKWCGYAHGLLRDIFLALAKRGPVTNADIMRAILSDPRDQHELVMGLPSAVHYTGGNEKYVGSVRSILANYTAPLLEFDPNSGADAFALARWIDGLRDADGRGKSLWPWLFLTTQTGDMSNAQKQLLSAHLSLAIHRTLRLPVNRQRRIWFVAEELGNLGAITGVKQMLSMGAKHGVCAVGLVQSTSQLEELYNEAGAQTLLSCFNSVVVSHLADPKTAKYFEEHFGKKEVVEWRRNEGSHGGQSSSGRSEQVHVRPRFYAHELQELDGECVTWIVGDRIRRQRVPKMRLPEIAEPFIPQHTPYQYPESIPTLGAFNATNSQTLTGSDGPKWKE